MTKTAFCILALCLLVQVSVAQYTSAANGLPTEVVNFVSLREQRLHHNLFHNVRMGWNYLDLQEQLALTKLGWAPPRPAYGVDSNWAAHAIDGAPGEDFLYMHHIMIRDVNAAAATGTSGWTVSGWAYGSIPTAADTDWPVPPAFAHPNADLKVLVDFWKSAAGYTAMDTEQIWLNSATNLASLDLGQLGVRLEFGMHDWMHMRYSRANTIGYRTQSTHPTAFIEAKWDVTAYDYLQDFYSAHCNVYFWKIHGWIENVMTAWKSAKSITQSDYPWVNTWLGGPMGSYSGLPAGQLDSDMVMQLSKVAADAEARSKATPQSTSTSDNNTTNVTAIVLGCVLGGLALILIFAAVVFYMIKVMPTKAKGGAYMTTSNPASTYHKAQMSQMTTP